MATRLIEESRISRLDPGRSPAPGAYVLYWMQAAVRTRHNQALELAAQLANRHGVPLLVFFGIDPDYPESSARHHRFLIEGLGAITSTLDRRRIGLRVEVGPPPDLAAGLAGDSVLVVTDRSYLRHLRRWRHDMADGVAVPVYEVETNLVVPVEVASDKAEYAARTIRPKIHRHLDDYLIDLTTTAVDHDGRHLGGGVDLSDPDGLIGSLGVDGRVRPSDNLRGGEHQARAVLDHFIGHSLADYSDRRSEPTVPTTSGLSPFLHFGHISPITILLALSEHTDGPGREAFVEELVVRRELAHNYTWYRPDYDTYDALPEWARTTLAEHATDPRPHLYSLSDLETARTHDRYWNAAMVEMRETGFMHNYMRMYWGKQILAWTESPRRAFQRALYLNNRYLLDGRDPNSYANVAWCFGLHDRPWPEREVFGKVRTMTSGGLRSK
ncbi:MAG: deoxyribodipyrimidine photo-lyase, partial [Acidimicrobiia bacterium]